MLDLHICIYKITVYSCGDGFALSSNGSVCEDINECLWNPCLHSSICQNSFPGMLAYFLQFRYFVLQFGQLFYNLDIFLDLSVVR